MDTVQGFLIIIASFFLGATVIMEVSKMAGGIGFFAQLKNGMMAAGDSLIQLAPVGKSYSWLYILTASIPVIGIFTSPPYLMIVASAKHPRIFRFQAFVMMTLIMGFMYYIFTYLIGMGGRSLFTSIQNTDALSLNIIFTYMGPAAFAVTAMGILAAMNSTAAGYMANTATILTRDIVKRYIDPSLTPGKEKWISRAIILGLVLAAAVFSVLVLDYITILGTLATSFSFQLFPAMVGITYLPRLRGNAVNAGIIVGLITVILTYFVWRFPLGIHMGGWGMIMNVLTIMIVQTATRGKTKEPDVAMSHALWDAEAAREVGMEPLVDLSAGVAAQK